MTVTLIRLFPLVIIFACVLLWLFCPDVKKKIKVPKLNLVFALFLSLILISGNLGYFWSPEIFYPIKVFLVACSVFFFLYNAKVPGFPIAGFGSFLNFLVMAANGMKMPIIQEYFNPNNKIYIPLTESTILPQLADIIKIEGLDGVYIISWGDVLIYVGGLITVLYFVFLSTKELFVKKK